MTQSGITKRFGVLVGASEFPEFPPQELASLSTPLNDVKLLAQALSHPSRGGFEVKCLINRTAGVIRHEIEELIKKAKSIDSLGLIYYSGHGLLDEANPPRLHLATLDGRPGYWSSLIAITEIISLITAHRPKRLILLLDCCYSGAGIPQLEMKGGGQSAINKFNESLKPLEGSGVVMMTATTRIQQAAGDTSTGFGIFTKHLVEGIGAAQARRKSNRRVTVNDLYTYVSKRMREEGCEQTPMLWNAQIGGDIVISESNLIRSEPIDRKLGWTIVRDKRALLNVIGPTYILDTGFNFIDWNTTFESFVAHPLALTRGAHVDTFLKRLRNWPEVFLRSNSVFVPGKIPTVDVEVVEYDSAEFGLIVFNKIATRLLNASGRLRAWCVNLNVSSIQRAPEFWRTMEDVLKIDHNWSRYALSYDKIISRFSHYQRLLDLMVANTGEVERAYDFGAGTGNVAMRLLEDHSNCTVIAVEKNDQMLDCLQRKLDAHKGYDKRAFVYSGDISTCLKEEKEQSADACFMLNVLFALDHPQEALSEVFRVLCKGGSLSLSTSHHDTDVKALFGEMQRDLRSQGLWDTQTHKTWEDAYGRNLDMETMIRRHSKNEIRDMVAKAGFRITEFHPSEYVGCVVVVKAVKD